MISQAICEYLKQHPNADRDGIVIALKIVKYVPGQLFPALHRLARQGKIKRTPGPPGPDHYGEATYQLIEKENEDGKGK